MGGPVSQLGHQGDDREGGRRAFWEKSPCWPAVGGVRVRVDPERLGCKPSSSLLCTVVTAMRGHRALEWATIRFLFIYKAMCS